MIKKEDKSEFIGQILDLFEDFLDEYGIKIPQKEGEEEYEPDTPANLCGKAYADLAEHLQTFFRSWGVIKDERPQIEYLFTLSLNGVKCNGTISVKAQDPDEAYRKAQDLAETRLDLPVAWLGAAITGRWLSSCSTGMADRSMVFLV